MITRREMLIQEGRVREAGADTLLVEVTPREGCARCARGEGCGFGLGSGDHSPRILALHLPPGPVPEVGDTVRVGIEDTGLLRAAAIAYGVPVIGLVAGAFASAPFSPGDGMAIGLSVAGFAAGIAVARGLARSREAARRCCPRLLPDMDDTG